MIQVKGDMDITEAVRFALGHLEREAAKQKITPAPHLQLTLDKTICSQGYRRVCHNNTITVSGADEAGIMYGILDLCRELCHMHPSGTIEDTEVVPYLEYRGIKLNIPLDARTPSYSDASDSAVNNIADMWDFSFWTEFLDRMALNRYNVLSLWSLSPFPSLVRIPEYPLTALEDVKMSTRPAKAELSAWGMYTDDMEKSLVTVKKMTMDEKITFWQSVMEYAKNRCIQIFLFTWNLFVYGTEGNPYGITCDQNNPVTKDYIYRATRALLDTYPLLAGLGVTSGEHMLRDGTDILFLADSYGRGVKDYLSGHPDREFRFIHRMQYTGYESIMKEFTGFACPFEISFKYSQAHMYSSVKPGFVDDFLREKADWLKLWLTVRNDDFYMYRWGDPEYAREYLKGMPVSVLRGYYMGADGYTWGRDYMDKRDLSHPLFLAKMWYMFMIWGHLSYNIRLSDDYFKEELGSHFGMEATELYESWKHASRVVPELNQVHWRDYDFQWYPEGCCYYDFETDKLLFADINEFIGCRSIPGGEYYGVLEYCRVLLRKEVPEKKDPLGAAETIREHAGQALEGAERLRRKADLPAELLHTLDDIEALGYLGCYYSAKLKAAVALCRYRLEGDTALRQTAVRFLEEAGSLWKTYSAKSKEMYRPQVLTRLCGYVDVQRFDRLAELDIKLALENQTDLE